MNEKVCVRLTSWFHQRQSFEVTRQQDIMKVSVAAIECDVAHISHHDVLDPNIVLPRKRIMWKISYNYGSLWNKHNDKKNIVKRAKSIVIFVIS